MNNILFTSDLHFMHRRIVEFTDRKLVTTQEQHDTWLIDLWNSQVDNSDRVYVLGDLSFGKITQTIKIFDKLKGQIFVIKGNHDRMEDLDELQDRNLIQKWYEYKELRPNDIPIVLFHFPIAEWHRKGYGALHLYGHSHGNFQNVGKSLDVGIDSSYNHFGKHKLFSIQEVLEITRDKSSEINDHRKDRTNAE